MDFDLATRMTSDEFLAWAEVQPNKQRRELHDGIVVDVRRGDGGIPGEQHDHNLIKAEIYHQLRLRLAETGQPYWVFTDGMAVEVNATTVFEPDVMVRLGLRLGPRVVKVTDPVIVVEVLSPSTERVDRSVKLIGYFCIPSVRHYLVVDPAMRRVVHHARDARGFVTTRNYDDKPIPLDPPGIVLADIFV